MAVAQSVQVGADILIGRGAWLSAALCRRNILTDLLGLYGEWVGEMRWFQAIQTGERQSRAWRPHID